MAALSIVVVHENFLIRTGLASTLSASAGIAVRTFAAGDAAFFDCDIVVADLESGMHFLDLLRQVPAATPRPRVVIVTESDREWQIRQVWAQGAAAYLLAGVSGEELLSTVRMVAQGQCHLSQAAMARLAESFLGERLTMREDEVLALVSDGLCNKHIAARLGISVATVKTHLRSAFDKLQVRSRAEAAATAGRRGILRPPVAATPA